MSETPRRRAYALKESIEDFAGGTIAFGSEGQEIGLKDALEAGDGYIVTEDPLLIAVLDLQEVLDAQDVTEDDALPLRDVEQEAADEAAEKAEAEAAANATDPNGSTKDDLLAEASRVGADTVGESNTKAEIAEAIDAAKSNEGGDA